MLEKIRYSDRWNGIDVEAYTDGYAYDQYSGLYLLSVVGYDSSVKAITSALVSGKRVEILSDDPIHLGTSFAEKYRILSTKLGSGLLHQTVLANGFVKSTDGKHKLLYIDRNEHAPQIVYNCIKKSYSVPLIPEWSEWLYKRIREENGLEELLGTRKVLKLKVSEEELDSIVSEGVKNGEIDF